MVTQLVMILRDRILPMAERLNRERLILPDAAGKKAFGRYRGDAKEAGGARKAPPPELSYTYAGHGTLELVFGFSGRAELALAGRRYQVAEGELGIIPSLVPHKERILGPEEPYHLIWFRCEPRGFAIHSSSYSRGNRFQLVHGTRFAPNAALAERFECAVEEARKRETAWVSRLRACFCEGLVLAIRHLEAHGTGYTPKQHRQSVVEFAKGYVQAHFNQDLTLKDIAKEVFLSPNYFSSLFKPAAGLTVFEYIQKIRLDEAARLLAGSALPVKQIARRVGIKDPAYFSRLFKRHTGLSARAYRERKGASEAS